MPVRWIHHFAGLSLALGGIACIRGVFTSTTALARRIMTYIRRYNDDPKPIKWQYDDPTKRIRVA